LIAFVMNSFAEAIDSMTLMPFASPAVMAAE
jgi:hypothetical protein